MNKLMLNVEVMAGTDLSEALNDAQGLARRMDLSYVCFKFNGVEFNVSQNADTSQMYYQYGEGATKGGVIG